MPRVSVQDLADMKGKEPITMLTAYNSAEAEIIDGEVEIVLVGDSVGNTRLGYRDTLPVTLEQSLSHTEAVASATEESMVVGDMPFMSYGAGMSESVRNAGRYLKEAGAQAVKLETPVGGSHTLGIADRLTELGVPVLGHTGLTPQHINATGGYRVEGRGEKADELLETAEKLEDAGVFAVVLEMVPEDVGRRVTEAVDVPTIGIGAGRYVDGQVLVIDDLAGLSRDVPSFVRKYADVRSVMRNAVKEYVNDVKNDRYPEAEHAFDAIED